jgi:hypothetical protein
VNRKPNRFTLIGQSPLDRLFDPPANAVAEYIVATEMPQNSSERAWLPKLLMGILGMLSRLPFILDFSNI